MYISNYPLPFAPAFNPIILQCQKEGEEIGGTLPVIIGDDESGFETINYYRDFLIGRTNFDISSVLRNYFNEELIELTENSLLRKFSKDRKLYVPYTVGSSTFKNIAINAVAQFRDPDTFFSQYIGKLLTKKTLIERYDGYPLDVTILAETEIRISIKMGDLTQWGSIEPMTVSRVNLNGVESISEYDLLGTKKGDYVQTKMSDYIGVGDAHDFVAVTDTCIPDCPFYVRYINMLGGVDYVMFGFANTHEISISENKTYKKYIQDYSIASGNEFPYKKTSKHVVTVGKENISNADFDDLSYLPFSPYIQWYDEKVKSWKTINISKAENVKNSRSELQNIEFQFLLPELNLQF